MIAKLKQALYFPIASYFRFFARIRLRRWNPRIIVITGSNGKTTALYLLEAQLGTHAKFSHHANSSFGIPFDILDIHRKTLQKSEWIRIIFSAPFKVFKSLPKEKIYVVEADVDRPYEGKFMGEFLKPEVVMWVSTSRTHSMNFDALVAKGEFKTVEEAIAFEYGWFLEHCQKLAIVDGDSELEMLQLKRTKAKVKEIKASLLENYSVGTDGTKFTIDSQITAFPSLLPKEVFLSIAMVKEVIIYLDLPYDNRYKNFHLPPGRGSVFEGIKQTTLIDSSYNGNLGSIKAILSLIEELPAKKKWVVLGDMKELGEEEREEHEALAGILNAMDLEKVILIGRIMTKYTLPLIKKDVTVMGFDKACDASNYLLENIKGGEVIFFKGSQSIHLEGLIELLLKNKEESRYLPRQEAFWKSQRKHGGFN